MVQDYGTGYFVSGNHCPFLRRKERMGQAAEHLGLAVLFQGCVNIAGAAVFAYPLFAAHPAIGNGIVHKLLPFGAVCRSLQFFRRRPGRLHGCS